MWAFMNTTADALSDDMDHGKARVKAGGYAYLAESSSLQYQVTADKKIWYGGKAVIFYKTRSKHTLSDCLWDVSLSAS